MTVDVCVRSVEKRLMKEENDVCVCVCQITLGYLSVSMCLHVTSSAIVWIVMDPERCLPPQLRFEMKTCLFQLGYEIYYSESQ